MALKRKGILFTIHVSLEDIVLSETRTNTNHKRINTLWFHSDEVLEVIRVIEIEN